MCSLKAWLESIHTQSAERARKTIFCFYWIIMCLAHTPAVEMCFRLSPHRSAFCARPHLVMRLVSFTLCSRFDFLFHRFAPFVRFTSVGARFTLVRTVVEQRWCIFYLSRERNRRVKKWMIKKDKPNAKLIFRNRRFCSGRYLRMIACVRWLPLMSVRTVFSSKAFFFVLNRIDYHEWHDSTHVSIVDVWNRKRMNERERFQSNLTEEKFDNRRSVSSAHHDRWIKKSSMLRPTPADTSPKKRTFFILY